MTQEELKTSHEELSRLAADLSSTATSQDSDTLQRIIATAGSILAHLGKTVSECKSQLDDVAYRERSRDRGAESLRDERAIRFFAQLKNEDREQLVQAVERTPPHTSIKAFSEQIAKETGLYAWNTTELLDWVSTWYFHLAKTEAENDVDIVASILIDPHSAEPSTKELLQAVDANNHASPFTQHLKRLLRCHSTLGVTSKAEILLGRNERQFGHATVSTDLRPIFSGNVEAAPKYGVVVHNLILGINDSGTFRRIELALTSRDILNLADVLNRAWKKEQTLQKHNAYTLLLPK